MKVSVIIPVYNVAGYVGDCLISVFNQTYNDIEIVIIDDCATDNSMQVVEEVVKKADAATRNKIKIVRHDHNRGLSAARNTGIRECTGDNVYFLDSDDEITPDCIEKLVTYQQETNADIVVGGYKLINGKSDFIYPTLRTTSCFIGNNKNIIKEYMRGRIYMMAWNKLVCKKILTDNDLFFKDGLIHEDDLWSFRCACCINRIAIVTAETYIYKIRPGSIMDAVHFEKEIEWRIIILKEMLDCIKKHKLETNRHVFSRLQEEKLSILYQCRKNNYREIAEKWYYTCPNIRTASLIRILRWYFFNSRKMIRDAHYFLPDPLNEEYYWNVPDYIWNKQNKRFKFYLWFIKVLICKVLHIRTSHKQPFT